MIFVFPPPDEEPWPTLGPEVSAFIEAELCHGPGDLLGSPVELSEEQRAWIYRMYEVYPPTLSRRKNRVIVNDSHPQAGKRRFQRCVLSLRKGSSKTEFAAWIAIAEVSSSAPVRVDGWRGKEPIGRGVTDPYIPMISYAEEQTEELAYGAARRILEESAIGRDFDIGLERIVRLDGAGKMEAVSASPNARDGARTTFQHADETHRFVLKTLKDGWKVMRANLSKRPIADPWALETTTAPEPGAGSVAEETMQYAEFLAHKGKTARLFFFHRQASDHHNLETDEGLRAAVEEASGPYIAKWSDIKGIVETFNELDADRPYLERVWLNRPVQAAGVAFDIKRYRDLARATVIPDGNVITLGFDGSRFDDNTALIATDADSGFQWKLGIWEPQGGEIPVNEVDAAVADAFERYVVARMYCDPPLWEGWISTWQGRYGDKVVVEWWTNRRRPMAYAIRSYITALASGELSHSGDKTLEMHVANARKMYTGLVDEQEKPLWILRKERPDSVKKIDGAMAAILSWEARNDARADGATQGGGFAFAGFDLDMK